jgi:hypothetical protein
MAVNTKDLAKRALHTFWQAFLAALLVAYAASGLNVSQVVDMGSAKKFAFALGVAVLGAVLSAVKTTLASFIGQATDPTPNPAPVISTGIRPDAPELVVPATGPISGVRPPNSASIDQATAFQQGQPQPPTSGQ